MASSSRQAISRLRISLRFYNSTNSTCKDIDTKSRFLFLIKHLKISVRLISVNYYAVTPKSNCTYPYYRRLKGMDLYGFFNQAPSFIFIVLNFIIIRK